MGKNKINNLDSRGFTLIELLVSVSIFIVLTVVTIASLKTGDQRSALRLQADQIVSDLRLTQNLALIAEPLSDSSIARTYGVRFNVTEQVYTIFAEKDDFDYILNGTDPVIETVNLGRNYVINSINEGNCTTMHYTFTVPEADVFFNGGQDPAPCGNYNPTEIEIIDTKTSNKIKIEVNWISGQISHTAIYQ